MVEEICEDCDRTLIDCSSRLTDFFSVTYGRLWAPLEPNKFDNASSLSKEVAIRTFIVLGSALALLFQGTFILAGAAILTAGSKVFRAAGFALQKNGFTHIKTSAKEKPMKGSIMTWNIRGHGGGLSYQSGVVHWRSRVDQIAAQISWESPDVVVLQEVYDPKLVETLVQKLGNDYAHFYAYAGASTFQDGSGCLVITKCAVSHFSHTNFSSDLERGFETIELKADPNDAEPCVRIFCTQLTPGAEAKQTRLKQVQEIVNDLALKNLALPTFLVGNMNLDRESEEGQYLSKFLSHSYKDSEPTHTAQLAKQWAPIYEGQEESSDFISLFKRVAQDGRTLPVVEKDVEHIQTVLIDGFEPDYNTKTARSDHHAVLTRYRLGK